MSRSVRRILSSGVNPQSRQFLSSYHGQSSVEQDTISMKQVAQLNATIGTEMTQGSEVPPLFHLMGWQTEVPLTQLGSDGHPKRGGELSPNVPGAWRRMFGGSNVVYQRQPHIGEQLFRESRLVKTVEKQGSAPLVLATLSHVYTAQGNEHVFQEDQTIIYVGPRAATDKNSNHTATQQLPQLGPARGQLVPCPTMLFRYSALTFNGHRIHYDVPYATDVEGYPGLVVHGPLLATVMAAMLRKPGMPLAQEYGNSLVRIEWRAVAPVFCSTENLPVMLHADPSQNYENGLARWDLHVIGPDGTIVVRGKAYIKMQS